MLEPDTFTLGFARRFATYKRATLLFRDMNRFKKLLMNRETPVQVVIAESEQGRGVLGVIDGAAPAGLESSEHAATRRLSKTNPAG